MAFGLTWFIHPLEKQQSLPMAGRREDAWWAGAGFSWDTVPVLGLCQADPSEHLCDLTSWKREEMGESGLNSIYLSLSEDHRPHNQWASFCLCPFVSTEESRGESVVTDHSNWKARCLPPATHLPPFFLSLPPSQQIFSWLPMRRQAGNRSVGKKTFLISWSFCSTVAGRGQGREV